MTQKLKHRTSTGVHITTDAIHIAHASAPDASLAEIQINSIPLSADDNQPRSSSPVDQTLTLLRKTPEAKSKEIVVTTSDHQFQYHSFRLAKMPESEIANAVHWKIAQETSSDPSSYKSDYFNVGTLKEGNENKLELVGMCVNQADLLALVDQYEANGWFVSAIDSPIAALVRGLKRLTPSFNTNEPQLVINLDREATQIIITLNNEIHFYKSLRTGADQLVSSLVRQFKTTYHKAIPIFNALNLHPDRINTVDQWHDAFPPQPQAEEVVTNATNQFLTNLTQELKLCFQHIRKAHPQLMPTQFNAIGLGATSSVINYIEEQFELEHHACCLPPEISNQLQSKQLIGINRSSQLATVLGLATYFNEALEQRRTA